VALFYSGDGVYLSYANLAAAKQFWIEIFGCSEAEVPPGWDDSMPSDIALKLPGEDEACIGLFDRSEGDRPNRRSLIFCTDINKAHAYLSVRGVQAGAIGELGGMRFFEIQDCEGNTIEICKG
jgi:predicted enzyme related to lactoylglutathione lyase